MTQGTYVRCAIHGCRKGVVKGQHYCNSHFRNERKPVKKRREPVKSDHSGITEVIRRNIYEVLREEGLI